MRAFSGSTASTPNHTAISQLLTSKKTARSERPAAEQLRPASRSLNLVTADPVHRILMLADRYVSDLAKVFLVVCLPFLYGLSGFRFACVRAEFSPV